VNPHLAHLMVRDRQRELERRVIAQPRPTGPRRSISRPLGLALMRVGQRLAGFDERERRRLRPLMLADHRRR
jgi:hypothetical protein